jgi:hypothetical protein
MIKITGGVVSAITPVNLPEHPDFRDIFYDTTSPDPIVLSGLDITSAGYTDYKIANPTLYIAGMGGLFMSDDTNAEIQWDILSDGNFTSIAKITDSTSTMSRLVLGGGGLVEFQQNTSINRPVAHHPYGRYGDYPSLYNAAIQRLLSDGSILIAGTTNRGAWNADYSNLDVPYWSQE